MRTFETFAQMSQMEERAESVNSLHLRRHTVKHMKAAIQGSGSTPHHAAPATKVSNAQEAEFAKSSVRAAVRDMPGPLQTLTEDHDAAVQLSQNGR